MTTTQKYQYADWLKGIGFNYTATLRSPFSLTQAKMDKYTNVLLKQNKDIETIYYTIEKDSDPYSKAQDIQESYRTEQTSTGNHAHLLIKTKNNRKVELVNNNLYRQPYTIPYYDEVNDLNAISHYIVKQQTEDNYNILFQASQNQQDFPY